MYLFVWGDNDSHSHPDNPHSSFPVRYVINCHNILHGCQCSLICRGVVHFVCPVASSTMAVLCFRSINQPSPQENFVWPSVRTYLQRQLSP